MPIPTAGLAEKRWHSLQKHQDQHLDNLVENKPVTTVIQKGNMEFTYDPDKISMRFIDRPEPAKKEVTPPPMPIVTDRTLREMEAGRQRIALRHDRTLREMEAGRKNNARYHPVEVVPEVVAQELIQERDAIETAKPVIKHQVKLISAAIKPAMEIQPPGNFKEYAPMHKPAINKVK